MKKIYKKPSAKEIKLNACTLLADSGNISDITANPDEDIEIMDSKGGLWHWMGEEN